MPVIEIKNINQGGIADSALVGIPNSVAEMVGLDIHSESGFIKANQALQADPGASIIDDFIKVAVACSDGNTYLFGSTNGKVWKRSPTGNYTLERTVAPSSGGIGIVGAKEYQGYVYYAMEEKLGRWAIGTAWAGADDDYATFRNGDAEFHPMKVLSLVLYIGDGNVVAQVDDNLETFDYNTLVGTFIPGEIITGGTSGATATVQSDNASNQMVIREPSAAFQVGETITGAQSGATASITAITAAVFSENALDLPNEYRIKCFGQLGTDLLIGTVVNSNVVATQIFRWNTWSVSYTNSDPIPEVGINSFLETDNFVIVNAGKKGNLYIYDGSSLDLYKQIPGRWSSTESAVVFPEASFNFTGLPLFGLSNESGNPTTLGIYSLGRTNRNYPYVLNCEYLLANRQSTNITIGTIIGAGNIFLVTWKNQAGEIGVDRLDLNRKFDGAYFTTRLMIPDRMDLTNFSEAFVGYRSLPTGCDIEFYASRNYDPFTQITDSVTDDIHKMKNTEVDIGEATTLQMKVVLRTSGNSSPEIDISRFKIKDNG